MIDRPDNENPNPLERPGKHPETKQHMILAAMEAITKGWPTIRIHEYFRRQYGLKIAATNGYIRLAREELVAGVAKPIEVLVAESYGTYMACINSVDTSWKEKLAARKAADELLGLPKRVVTIRHERPEDTRLEIAADQMTAEQLIALTELVEKMEALEANTVESDHPKGLPAPQDWSEASDGHDDG